MVQSILEALGSNRQTKACVKPKHVQIPQCPRHVTLGGVGEADHGLLAKVLESFYGRFSGNHSVPRARNLGVFSTLALIVMELSRSPLYSTHPTFCILVRWVCTIT